MYTYEVQWVNNKWAAVHSTTQEVIQYFPNWSDAYKYVTRLNMYYDVPWIVKELASRVD